MDFEITADGTKLPHPKEGPAQAEEAKTAELAVRDVDTKSENAPSMAESKGDNISAEIKGGHTGDLLNFDPYGQKPSEAEQTTAATDDRGPATTQPRNENPLEHFAGGHDDIIMEQGKEEQDVVGETGLTPSNLLGDTPANPSSLLSADPISVKPTDTFVPESTGDVAPITNVGDGHEDTAFAPSERKADPFSNKITESGATESEIDHIEPAATSYSNEPTPKSNTTFEMPIASPAIPTTADDLLNFTSYDQKPSEAEQSPPTSDETFNPIASDPVIQPQNPSHAAQSLDVLSAAEEEKPMPQKTSIFPKSESPIPLEADTKLDEPASIPSASSPTVTSEAAEATNPYINPDPFQEYIPPVEKEELGDHRLARIPSPSSMDVEPPTPVERSALSSLKESEEIQPAMDAEGVVEKLPLEALRHRDVQEALASVIPPAPDKPLPPTPSSESRATARSLIGHFPVMEILLWRDPKKSGAAFVTGLVVLLSMMYCSFISVVAYFALALLTVTLGFRLYKTVMGMVQKTNDGHPFQDLLSVDTTVTPEKGHELADKVVAELNCCTTTLKDLFLVKDIFESVKFGFVLYLLTYLGAWFNTMTLVIMGYVVMFTLPKVYEQNKEKIDEVLGQLKEKFGEISAKVKAAIPMGKKAPEPATEEKKEE